jgi:hypothetical protein
MSAARKLLDDLAVIGATVEPAGDRLILRAGPTAIPATLVRRVKDAKSDMIAILNAHNQPEEKRGPHEGTIVRWLDEHPGPSPAGRCAWCGCRDLPGAVALPFGTVPGTHTWLHAECWRPWQDARRAEAVGALSRIGGFSRVAGRQLT